MVISLSKLYVCMLAVPPQITPFEFTDNPVNSGDLVSILCAVSKGDPPLDISWLLNGRDVSQVDGISVIRTNKKISQLSIDSVQAEHSGEYSCFAKNSAGNASFSAILYVNGKASLWFLSRLL